MSGTPPSLDYSSIRQEPLALASVACGALGILTACCCGALSGPFALAAIILGAVALFRINADPLLRGKELAYVGIVLGVLDGVLIAVALVFGLSAQVIEAISQYRRR